jgi:hypothetical protein
VPDSSPPTNPNNPTGRQPGAGKLASTAPSRPEEKGIYKYLPIECPNCGFQGKINISRLDQTFHCKECNQVFHVTKDGTVAGERPAEAATIDHSAPSVEEKPNWLEQKFVKLPAAAKWSVLGVFALLLVYGLVKLFEPAEPLPGDLEDRVELAAKSFAQGKWSTLKRMAKPGTARLLSKWYDANRPKEWNDASADEMQSKVVSVRKALKRYEKQTPIMDAQAMAQIQAPGQPAYEVPFIWDQTDTGEWWIDGERMLTKGKPRKKVEKPKEADDPKEDSADSEVAEKPVADE